MNLSEIAPTKTNLLDFKDQLAFSQNGHALLEQKREVLVMHLMDIISQIKEQREKLDKYLAEAYQQLHILEIEIGEFELDRLVQGMPARRQVIVREKTIMGVSIPTIKYTEVIQHDSPQVSLSATTFTYDSLLDSIQAIMDVLLLVAQTEIAAWRLSFEIKKTQRRVNALENVFIPDFLEIVKFIQNTLEERERETFFQMKRVKNAHLRDEAGREDE